MTILFELKKSLSIRIFTIGNMKPIPMMSKRAETIDRLDEKRINPLIFLLRSFQLSRVCLYSNTRPIVFFYVGLKKRDSVEESGRYHHNPNRPHSKIDAGG